MFLKKEEWQDFKSNDKSSLLWCGMFCVFFINRIRMWKTHDNEHLLLDFNIVFVLNDKNEEILMDLYVPMSFTHSPFNWSPFSRKSWDLVRKLGYGNTCLSPLNFTIKRRIVLITWWSPLKLFNLVLKWKKVFLDMASLGLNTGWWYW